MNYESVEGAPIRILLTGANGQLGKEIQRLAARAGVQIVAMGREKLNIATKSEVMDAVNSSKPTHIINAAAYTNVDLAEKEKKAAYAANFEGAAWLGEAAHAFGCKLIHVSTDFVFDGKKSTPYTPSDKPAPLNVYGASKLAGEQAILSATGENALIIRTAWLYAKGEKNFCTTMLRLMQEKSEIRVVEDQIGTPTHVSSCAQVLLESCSKDISGIYHWTDAGVASWYDFAIAISDVARECHFLSGDVNIIPIASKNFPSVAERPAYSVLDKSFIREFWSIPNPHWISQLKSAMTMLE